MKSDLGRMVAARLVMMVFLLAGGVPTESQAQEISVTVPNGIENGDLVWISGIDYDVTWTWSGNVSSNLVLEYSIWSANNAASFTPAYPTIRARAKVTLISPPADPNIFDVSDVNCVVAGVLVVSPQADALYNLDSVEDIEWISAGWNRSRKTTVSH